MTRPSHQLKLDYLRPLRPSPWNWHAGSVSLAIAAAILVIAGAVAPLVAFHVGSPSEPLAWLGKVFLLFWLASPLAGIVCGIVAVYRERPYGLTGLILSVALYPLVGLILVVWGELSGFD
jgi:hypothetical protein